MIASRRWLTGGVGGIAPGHRMFLLPACHTLAAFGYTGPCGKQGRPHLGDAVCGVWLGGKRTRFWPASYPAPCATRTWVWLSHLTTGALRHKASTHGVTGADRRGRCAVVSALMWHVRTCHSAASAATDSDAGADGDDALGCVEILQDGLDNMPQDEAEVANADHQIGAEELKWPNW